MYIIASWSVTQLTSSCKLVRECNQDGSLTELFLYPVTVITNFLHYFHCIIIIVIWKREEGAMSLVLVLSWLDWAYQKKLSGSPEQYYFHLFQKLFLVRWRQTTTISISLSTLFIKFLLWSFLWNTHSFFGEKGETICGSKWIVLLFCFFLTWLLCFGFLSLFFNN